MVDEEKTMNPLRLQRLASKKELPKKFAVRWKCMFSTKYVSKPKKQAKPWGDSAISRFLSHGKLFQNNTTRWQTLQSEKKNVALWCEMSQNSFPSLGGYPKPPIIMKQVKNGMSSIGLLPPSFSLNHENLEKEYPPGNEHIPTQDIFEWMIFLLKGGIC